MKRLMLALAAGVGFSALALAVEAASDDVRGVSSVVITQDAPPEGDPPEGEPPDGYGGGTGGGGTGGGGETPPDKPGGGSGGGSDDTTVLTGVLTVNGGTEEYSGGTLTSSHADENVILAQTNATLTVSNYTLNKSGDTSSEDNSNFFALNAVVAAKTAAKIYIDNSTLNSNADGANCLFASGSNSTIYAYNCALTSTTNSSRGLDATYGGTVIAAKMTITTSGDHCASLATDRGNGYISVSNATLNTAGQGSALIYSTGIIEANGVTGTATGAQIAGIEGLSTIRIRNSDLTGSGKKASEPVANGVIIYQSMSGDSTEGTATFEVSDSTLASAISGGAMFYITHSEAVITVQNTDFEFDTTGNYLLKAAGNDGSNGWGTAGSNGAEVVFTAIDQTLAGNVTVDGISSLDMHLVNSKYTGAFENDTTYTGDGDGIDLFISSNSTWTVTASCTVKSLTVATGAKIVDGNGNSVSIVESGETRVSGSSAFTVTVSDYVSGTFVATNITAFEIDRTAFEAMYGTSGGEGGGSGGSSGTGSKTYYFKPHAPTNAVVGVSYNGTKIYPDMDHKYWLDDYWTNGVTVTVDYSANTGYFFADGSSATSMVLTITENKIDLYPPAGFETARLAQARSGSTYYPTLKEAVDAGKKKITLNDNVTLDETLEVTNSITLNLNTNVVTLGSALTEAFHFTANATVSNGTVSSSLAANAEGSVLMRFTDCKATLKDLTVNGRGYETVVAHDSTKDLAKKYAKDASDTMTCDGLAVTGNGCLLSVDYANATLSETCTLAADGTLASFGGACEAAVSCVGNGTVTIAGGAYASPKVLQSGDLGGKIVVNGGTFSGQIYSWMSASAHTDLNECDDYKAQFTFNGGTYDDASIAFAYADSLDFSTFAKGEDVTIAVPSGYAWKDNVLVQESATAGIVSESYSDAQAATNAAAKINADKSGSIAVPAAVEESLRATYLGKVEATVTGDNRVVVDLTPAAAVVEQAVVDAAVTSATVVVSLVSTNATATIEKTTPGLYYWIEGGTEVNAVTNAGAGVLSTDGGPVELPKPTLDATKGKAFFKVAAGVLSPASQP